MPDLILTLTLIGGFFSECQKCTTKYHVGPGYTRQAGSTSDKCEMDPNTVFAIVLGTCSGFVLIMVVLFFWYIWRLCFFLVIYFWILGTSGDHLWPCMRFCIPKLQEQRLVGAGADAGASRDNASTLTASLAALRAACWGGGDLVIQDSDSLNGSMKHRA